MTIENESQPEGELDGDAAAMSLLAAKRQAAPEIEGAEAEAEEPESEEADAESGEQDAAPDEGEDDPEIDLGDIKLRKSELRAGYMKDADYRRKTADAAEAKREAQAIQERVQAERSYYANNLDVVLNSLQTQLIGDQAALATLAQTDPAEWVAENAKFQQRYADYQKAVHERQSLSQRQQADDDAKHGEYVQSERAELQRRLPAWSDPKVAQKESLEIAEYLVGQGYAQEDLASLQDHRALLIARDAAKWQQHTKTLASAKAKQAPKEPARILKPGAANQNQQSSNVYTDALKQARKTGSDDSVMAMLAARRSK